MYAGKYVCRQLRYVNIGRWIETTKELPGPNESGTPSTDKDLNRRPNDGNEALEPADVVETSGEKSPDEGKKLETIDGSFKNLAKAERRGSARKHTRGKLEPSKIKHHGWRWPGHCGTAQKILNDELWIAPLLYKFKWPQKVSPLAPAPTIEIVAKLQSGCKKGGAKRNKVFLCA